MVPTPDDPRTRGVLEACLYAEDLEACKRFYVTVLGLEPFAHEAERHVFFRSGGQQVFLLFNPERTRWDGGSVRVPLHGTTGHGHIAFAIDESELDAWRSKLRAHGITLEADIQWPRGGHSLYIRDPAGNSVELATPSLWGSSTPLP